MSELLAEPTGQSFSGNREPAIATADAIHVAAFRAALRSFLRTSEEVAQANGLTPRRHLLLLLIKGSLDGKERATITELAERLQLAQSTVTELVKRAEQARLLVRERSAEDARVVHLRLSEEGERRLARVFHSHEAEREKLRQILAELRCAPNSSRRPSPAEGGTEYERAFGAEDANARCEGDSHGDIDSEEAGALRA
jgi:DNA-binding MarR family transcriptional regulator